MFGLDLIPKEKILKYFTEKYLEKDDRCIIAFYDKNNEVDYKIFKYNFLEKASRDIHFLINENKELKEKIKVLQNK